MAVSPSLYRKTFDYVLAPIHSKNFGPFIGYASKPENGIDLLSIRKLLVDIAVAKNKGDIFKDVNVLGDFKLKPFQTLVEKFNEEFYSTFERAYWTSDWKLIDPDFVSEGSKKLKASITIEPAKVSVSEEDKTGKPTKEEVKKVVQGSAEKLALEEETQKEEQEIDKEAEIIPRGTAQQGTAATNKPVRLPTFTISETPPAGEPSIGPMPGEVTQPAPSSPPSGGNESTGETPSSQIPVSQGGGQPGMGSPRLGIRPSRVGLPRGFSQPSSGGILNGPFSNNPLANFARGRGGLGLPNLGSGARRLLGGGNSGRGSAQKAGGSLVKRFLIILVIFMLIFAIISSFNSIQPAEESTPGGEVKVEKSGPEKVANDETISYFIKVTNVSTKDSVDIQVTDKLSSQVEYRDSSPTPTKTANPIVWELKKVLPGETKTINLSVRPKEKDVWVKNEASAVVISGGTGGGGGGGGGIIDVKSANLSQIFEEAAKSQNMPVAVLKAIVKTEAPRTFEYNEEEVIKFSRIGWWEGLESEASTLAKNHPDIVRGYGYNTCVYRGDCAQGSDVRGVAQFLLTTWNGVKGGLSFSDGHDPDRRNLIDAIFGSALFNRRNAELYAGSSKVEWNEDVIKAIARMYCAGSAAGKNPSLARGSACGGAYGYDNYMWDNYLKFSGQ